MAVSSLTSFKYWDIGENHLNQTHLRLSSRLSQKQNIYIDVFTMVGVHQTSNRHIQAVQALALQPAVWGISCLVLLPSYCNDSSLHSSFSNDCKATAVTTSSESIAIYCVRNLVSCVTHLQSLLKFYLKNRCTISTQKIFLSKVN